MTPNLTTYVVLVVGTVAAHRKLYCHYLQTDNLQIDNLQTDNLQTDTRCHYTLFETDTIPTAISLCQDHSVNAILIDDAPLGTIGSELMQALQNQFDTAHPPVVMIADAANSAVPLAVVVQSAVRAMKLGVEDYLIKDSLTPAQLQQAVKNVIQNRKIQNTRSPLPPHPSNESHIQKLNHELSDRITELQALIDITPVGIAIATDPSCSYMQCNAYMRQLLGVKPGHNISKSAPAEDRPTFRVFQHGQEMPTENLPMQIAARLGIDVRDTEIEIRLPDGTARQLLSYATPLRGDGNEIRGVVGTFLDITERNRMEAELRKREATIRQQLAELESIYATAPVGLCFQDRDLRYVRINERLAEINGVPVADHLGRTTHEVLPELADTVAPLHRHVLETGEPILNIEIQGTTKAQPQVGRDWIASYYPLKGADGNVLGVNIVVQDISERKQAERDRLLLAQIVESSSEAIMGLTLDRQIISWNAAAEQIFGYTTAEILGQDLTILIPVDRREEPVAIFNAIRQGKIVNQFETVWQRKDGSLVDVAMTVSPIKDARNEIIGVSGTVRDITTQKQLEREREQLLAQAQAARHAAELANRSKDEFVVMVAHELRSPLNAIMGWAKLLQARPYDTETTHKALATIIRNTEAQVQLVEDLLDISRMVRGTLQLTITPVNLQHVLEIAVETVSPLAEAKQLQLEVKITEIPTISGDFNRLQQVVLNLLTNAIKFTPTGGRVEVVLEQSNSQAWIQIRDTGKGIHPDFLPHIFERFQQDRHNTTAQQGLGLGLTIVKHLVEMHHGIVTAASAGEGQGATFTVRLPLPVPGQMIERRCLMGR